jgi:hypothetical protein
MNAPLLVPLLYEQGLADVVVVLVIGWPSDVPPLRLHYLLEVSAECHLRKGFGWLCQVATSDAIECRHVVRFRQR